MADNIITAVFGATRETKVRPRYRYDRGQVLIVRGLPNLPDFYEVHFANEGSTADATPLIGTADGVTIPDTYFQSGATIYAYIYVHNEATDGTTVYKVTIPIINRARPANIEPTPEQEDIIAQAIVALNENVGRAEDAAEQAEASAESAESAASSVEALTARAEAAAQAAEASETNASSSATAAQSAAQNAAGSASDAADYMGTAAEMASNATTAASRASSRADAAASYASQAQQSANSAASAKTDAQTARTQAQGYRQAAEAAATRAETAAEEITGMTAEAETLEPGSPATASFLDGVLSLGIPAGANGADGNGIVSIVKSGTSGNIDTYTITYTNGTTSVFTVTNGVDGAVTSVAGKTGAITLNAGDVAFDDQQAYNDGTVGAGLTNLKSQIGEIINTTDVPEELTLVPNEYISSNGIKPYNGWSRTDYIPVTPGSTIKIVYTGSTNLSYTYWFDASKVQGSSKTIKSGTNTITVPNTAYYIMISGSSTNMQLVSVYLGEVDVDLKSTLPLTAQMRNDVSAMIEDGARTGATPNPTAYLMKQMLPDYYFSRNETPTDLHDIGYMEDKINSIPDGYHFIFVTDTHWNDNATQSTKMISYVRDRIGAKYVVCGGDILTQHSSKALAYRWLHDYIADSKNAFGGYFLPAVGNHDLNHANSSSDTHLTYDELIPLFTQGCDRAFHYCNMDTKIDSMVTPLSIEEEDIQPFKDYFKTIYYVDDVYGKTRFIVYNTGAGDCVVTKYLGVEGSNEDVIILDWIYDVLMSTPSGYNVVMCSHIPAAPSVNGTANTPIPVSRRYVPAMLAAFKAKQMLTENALTNNDAVETWYGAKYFAYDYTNAPNVGTVAIIGGHYHVDTFIRAGFDSSIARENFFGAQTALGSTSYGYYPTATTYVSGTHYKYEIPIIFTQNDAYLLNDVTNTYPHTYETVNEQSFDVITFQPGGNIKLTRFGAGYDRTVSALVDENEDT